MQLVLSLFPGLDMLGTAFELEGFCVVAGPDVCWGRDVRSFHPPASKFDGIIGGPPCQTFSALANLVRAKGLEPSFGNLIPEFVRCIEEAQPAWWLMENVPGVPEDCWPEPAGYGVHTFMLDNAWLDSGDGFGEEQMRKRRFWFGQRGSVAKDLRKWIRLAALELPSAGAVVADQRSVPVAIGGSGKVKRTATSTDGRHGHRTSVSDERRQRTSILAGHGPLLETRPKRHPKNGHGERYTLTDMLRLQGLPEDALDYAPFTMHGKRKLIGNGVAIPTGRALARAVREATA